MLLHELDRLYERLAADPSYEVALPGYSLQKITFLVVLDLSGRLVAIEDARVDDGGRARPRQLLVPGSTKPPGSGLNPCFLWDTSTYMLGFAPDDPKPDRTNRTFEAFREKHLALETTIDSKAFGAVCRFLAQWDPANGSEHPVLQDPAACRFGVFKIHGEESYVHEDSDIGCWWDSQAPDDHGAEGECLVSGRVGPLARTHDKIRGVRGATGAGAPLVGFNDPAYESYGKSQSYNAPVAEAVAFRYATALNALLDGPRRTRHRLVIGDTTIAFWTDRASATEDIFLPFASEGLEALPASEVQNEGQRQAVLHFLEALRKGRPAYGALEPDPEGTRFFLLGLSPNAGRVSVRFFLVGSVALLLDNLRRHHADIGLVPATAVGRRAADPEFPGWQILLDQTARERKDISPTLHDPLVRSVILGADYPVALCSGVLRRIRADRVVNYARCCVLKGYLNRNLKLEMSMALDVEQPDPGYRLGRLFAALEKTQRDALPEVNTTIRDSFYGSASATPSSVFPRLLRTYQHHLAKLDTGRRIHRERLVQEILAPVDAFPAHLGMAGQAAFALGYYHQTRDFYTKHPDTSPGENTGDSR